MLWGKNINVYINSARRSPSLYTKWLSMKNELCISSLTKKNPKTWLFQTTDCTIIVLNNCYYTSCHWVKNEVHLLGSASVSVTSPQSSIAAFPIPIYTSMTDTATAHTERAELQSRAKAMPKLLFEQETYRFIYTCINCATSQLHTVFFQCQPTSINGAVIFLGVGNTKCYKNYIWSAVVLYFF